MILLSKCWFRQHTWQNESPCRQETWQQQCSVTNYLQYGHRRLFNEFGDRNVWRHGEFNVILSVSIIITLCLPAHWLQKNAVIAIVTVSTHTQELASELVGFGSTWSFCSKSTAMFDVMVNSRTFKDFQGCMGTLCRLISNYLTTFGWDGYWQYSGASEGIVSSLCAEQPQLAFLFITQAMTVAHFRVLRRQLMQQLTCSPSIADASSGIRHTLRRQRTHVLCYLSRQPY